jgi:hypothetical protein
MIYRRSGITSLFRPVCRQNPEKVSSGRQKFQDPSCCGTTTTQQLEAGYGDGKNRHCAGDRSLSAVHLRPPAKPDFASFALIASTALPGLANSANGTASVVTVGWNKTISGEMPKPRWIPMHETPALAQIRKT